jgi:UDP-3-O-[3-hydroxymyristoyl] glucosamine N-acyltransferase
MNRVISAGDIAATFPQLIMELRGDNSATVNCVASSEAAQPQSLVYANQSEMLQQALNGPASVILTSPKLLAGSSAPATETAGKALLVSRFPDLAYAFVTRKYFGRDLRAEAWWHPRIHSSAVIAPNARIGQRVIIGPNAVIGSGCVLEDDVYVGPNSVLEEGARVGRGATLHAQVFIGHDCIVGDECEILPHVTLGSDGYGYAHDEKGQHHRIPHQGRVVLGARVDIGANCAIDRGTISDTVIGEGTKMDNMCHIAHNTRIGKFCLITACFVTGGSAKIGDYVVVGGRTTVSGHLTVGDKVQIGAHAGVTSDLMEPGQYSGYPLQPLKDYLKTTASMVHLPRLRKDVARLMKKVFPEENI